MWADKPALATALLGPLGGIATTPDSAYRDRRVRGLLEPKKDGNGEVVSAKFNAKGRIPMTATFSADADSAAVRMNFVNFDSLGTATKNVPAAQLNESTFDAIGRYHPFDGDGMLHAITFANGRASYRNRMVKTTGLAEELAAAIRRVDADPEVGAIVVTGAGKGFCAGANLGNLAAAAGTGAGSFESLVASTVAPGTSKVTSRSAYVAPRNAIRSRSRSTTRRVATDCTRRSTWSTAWDSASSGTSSSSTAKGFRYSSKGASRTASRAPTS